MNMHVCSMRSVIFVDRGDKMPSNITVYDAEIKIKYSHLNQGSVTQCYLVKKDSLVESILKENLY